MKFLTNVVQLARRGQLEFLRQRVETRLGVHAAVKAGAKLGVYEYLKKLLLGRDGSVPEANRQEAVASFRQGASECRHLPVVVEYSDTFTGCNIHPPCGKCFSVPKPKIEYAFAGNDFKGLESVVTRADAIYLGSIAELTFDKNYPAVIDATAVDGLPRLAHPTNGILVAGHMERIAGNVRALVVSMDAHTAELYGRLQGKPGHFAEILLGLRKLAELKQEKATPYPHVCISVVVSKENLAILEDVYRFYSEPALGIDTVLLSRLGPVSAENPGRVRKDFVFDFEQQLVPESAYWREVKKLKANFGARRPRLLELTDYLTYYPVVGREDHLTLAGPVCPIPWIYTQVSTTGAVSLCCYTPTQTGNWRTQGFEAVWNGPKMRQIRAEIAGHGVSRHCLDGTCPVVDRLDSVAQEQGHASLLQDLRRDWEDNVERIDGLMKDAIRGTVRENAHFVRDEHSLESPDSTDAPGGRQGNEQRSIKPSS